MKIALCDDDALFLLQLKDRIYQYANLHNVEPVIDCFHSGEDIIKSKIKYDLVILDFQMGGMDGISVAKILRQGKSQFSSIIFLTSFPEIAIPAYGVDAYRFVLKSSLYGGLYKALDDYLSKKELNYDISIKSECEHLTVNTSDVIFIEAQNKDIYVHVAGGKTIKTKTPLSTLYQMLPHCYFCQTHKAFVVNFKYVQKRECYFIL